MRTVPYPKNTFVMKQREFAFALEEQLHIFVDHNPSKDGSFTPDDWWNMFIAFVACGNSALAPWAMKIMAETK